MNYTELGRTGLKVSVAGLGAGGESCLGLEKGATVEHAISVVRSALDQGVNYIDTSPEYGTEAVIGQAVKGDRDSVIISTKALTRRSDKITPINASELRHSVEESLTQLDTDRIDVMHLQGVWPSHYGYFVGELVPELINLREKGAIRFLALSERFSEDPTHAMLQVAVETGCWDVMMVGFNVFNPTAREKVFPQTIKNNIGIEVMVAVRNLFNHNLDELRGVIANGVAEGNVDPKMDVENPLDFRIGEAGIPIAEAAYRFARHEPGTHIVLTGSGNLKHLEDSIRCINLGPLSVSEMEDVTRLFGHAPHVGVG